MIRDRLEQDLDRLCVVLLDLQYPAGPQSVETLREWLQEHDAERSWVYDMAPVSVAPTKNVVGHVQIYRPKSADDQLAIGKLFVKPNGHEYGIGRYLLKESVKYIQRQGKLPVLDLHENRAPAADFFERFGFEAIPGSADKRHYVK